MTPLRLRDVVEVKGRFHRSVQLARDWTDRQDLDSYVLTPTARELATRMAGALLTPDSTRAWSITGPYGSGKSAFALFLADLLARGKPLHAEAAAIRRTLNICEQIFLPVLVVGQRTALTPALLLSLADSVTPL